MQSTYVAVMIYAVIPFLIPLGFVFALGAVLAKVSSLRTASNPCARNFWRWNVLAHLLFAYAVLVLTLVAADTLLGEPWQLLDWWPSLAKIWSRASSMLVLVLLDVATALIGALAALGAARYFGYVDDANIWRPPLRLQLRSTRHDGD